MNRLRFSLLAAVCLTAPARVVWSAPAPAERSGLEQVPATAPLVVHLRGVQGTRDRFVAMMEKALPDVLKKFQTEMDDLLKEGRGGRKIRGLVKDGPHFFVLTELPKPGAAGDQPPFAILVAVSDYKEFRDNILTEKERDSIKDKGDGIQSVTIENESSPTYFLDRKGYAVVTPNEEVAKSFTKKQAGLNTKMSKEQAAKLLSADLGLYVNMESVNKEYGEQIKEAKNGLDQLLGPLSAAGDESQKKAIELVKKAIGPIFRTVEDMHAGLVTVEFRPGGLALHLQSEMKENSTTANLLQDSRPVALKELERLPRDRAFYIGMKTSAALYENLGGLMFNMASGATKETSAPLAELGKTGPGIVLGGLSLPMAGLTVYHFDDPAKAVTTILKMYRDMDPKTAKFKEKPKVKADAEKYGDFQLHSVQTVPDFDKMAEPLAQQGEEAKKQYIESMKRVLGEKTTAWIGTDGKTVVQVIAADWPAARKLLDQYTKGTATVGEVQGFRDARKEMPARTSLLSLIDAVHMFGVILEGIKPMLAGAGVPVPPGWPNVPAKGTPAFVGLSVTLQPGRGGLDLFITAAAAQEFYKAAIKPFVGE